MRINVTGKAWFRYVLLGLMLVIAALACIQSENVNPGRDMEARIRAVGEEWQAGRDIEVVAELLNHSQRRIKLKHRSPLLQVQIYEDSGKPLIDLKPFDDKSIKHTLNPGEVYDPDSKGLQAGIRTVHLDKPGSYKLVATASFDVLNGDGTFKSYSISSRPTEIVLR